ncbi:MAG: hypothetical protein AAF609_02160 [Cyanobacteria bacterium P01_C01_bin.120]
MTVSFRAFRDRHPTAKLTSELLLVQSDRFVVRVLIETDSGGCASGLAAHTSIEIAEDQARQRALEGMGWSADEQSDASISASAGQAVAAATAEFIPTQPPTPAVTIHTAATATAKATDSTDTVVGAAIPEPPVQQSQLQPAITEKPAPPAPSPTKSDKASSALSLPSGTSTTPTAPKPELLPDSPSPTITADLPTASDTAADDESEPIVAAALPAPINLSDVIAQTDIELRRLGWSVEIGREYLEHTYQKRSRHELSEEELIQFLCHLESL